MIIKGTNKIKGALDLSAINKQVKAGDQLFLSEAEFADTTVQTAKTMGFITCKEGGAASIGSTRIKLRNIYDRAIRINAVNAEIRPGEEFLLSEDDVNGSDIRGALAKGLLEIVSSTRSADISEEVNVRIGSLFEESTEAKMPYLETNEEITDPGVINTPTPKPVEKEDIPDPKGKTVVWNPNRDPIAHTRTQMDAVTANKVEVEAVETDVRISDDISFVDAELDRERKKSHPILKDKPDADDDGIDFL